MSAVLNVAHPPTPADWKPVHVDLGDPVIMYKTLECSPEGSFCAIVTHISPDKRWIKADGLKAYHRSANWLNDNHLNGKAFLWEPAPRTRRLENVEMRQDAVDRRMAELEKVVQEWTGKPISAIKAEIAAKVEHRPLTEAEIEEDYAKREAMAHDLIARLVLGMDGDPITGAANLMQHRDAIADQVGLHKNKVAALIRATDETEIRRKASEA